MAETWYEIRTRSGGYLCKRRTPGECFELIAIYGPTGQYGWTEDCQVIRVRTNRVWPRRRTRYHG